MCRLCPKMTLSQFLLLRDIRYSQKKCQFPERFIYDFHPNGKILEHIKIYTQKKKNPQYQNILDEFYTDLTNICDPESVNIRAKKEQKTTNTETDVPRSRGTINYVFQILFHRRRT